MTNTLLFRAYNTPDLLTDFTKSTGKSLNFGTIRADDETEFLEFARSWFVEHEKQLGFTPELVYHDETEVIGKANKLYAARRLSQRIADMHIELLKLLMEVSI